MSSIIKQNTRTMLFIFTLVGSWPGVSVGALVRWPGDIVTEIVSCSDSAEETKGECALSVFYRATQETWKQVEVTTPSPNVSSVFPWGIHCNDGTKKIGFTRCFFTDDTGHRPQVDGQCFTVSGDSWEIRPDSSCQIYTGVYGGHSGAGYGAECVIWGKSATGNRPTSIITPQGEIDVHVAANSGSLYCTKPLPPPVKCAVILGSGGILDHGEVSQSGESTITINGSFDECGINPTLEFVGGNVIKLGAGVSSELSIENIVAPNFIIKSKLTTIGAEPGNYEGQSVLVVSPN